MNACGAFFVWLFSTAQRRMSDRKTAEEKKKKAENERLFGEKHSPNGYQQENSCMSSRKSIRDGKLDNYALGSVRQVGREKSSFQVLGKVLISICRRFDGH
jgi:hypothetical protein